MFPGAAKKKAASHYKSSERSSTHFFTERISISLPENVKK
jgi:hypothetical protein